MKEPVARSDLRLALGGAYYGTLRKLLWLKERSSFAREHCEAILPYSAASHKTPLMRRLRDVDMWMQENKVTNLRLASARVNGIVLHPGADLQLLVSHRPPDGEEGLSARYAAA